MLRDRWLFGRATGTFTLQWHLTNACPFHCRHCYDRSTRGELTLEEAQGVLTDLRAFCRAVGVQPQLSLSGGDPFHYPHFWELYRTIAEGGIRTSILGNPVPAARIGKLVEIWRPSYYQVSLEGLREHNDFIRGRGHFDLVMAFLENARGAGLETHVMLTLTRANLDQVLPLAQQLRGLVARFTFNRLSQVGEGEDVVPPAREDYADFLKRYLDARAGNPILGFKDNLFNILRHRGGRALLPGCTGHGCGAAFNFVALLPDGEVHACRKFPSQIGNIRTQRLLDIYRSRGAMAYRKGPAACQGCGLRKSCGGCLAVVHGRGMDPLKAVDPDCFAQG
jgi:selenobiotic family peptide radical SAM maturase